MNIAAWALIACASIWIAGSIFVPPYQCRMNPVDSRELRQWHRMVAVLQQNVRVLSETPASTVEKDLGSS